MRSDEPSRLIFPGAALLVLVLAGPFATASLIEQASAGIVTYQFDGNTHHDAPDLCSDAAPAWNLPYGGTTDGILVPGDDPSDVFLLDVPQQAVGTRLIVRLSEMLTTPNAEFTVFAPGCAGSVLEPQNHPFPPPAPPAPAADEKQVTPENLEGPWECDSSAWVFKINQMFATPSPASVHAAWTDGSEQTVYLSQEAGVSRFETTEHTGFTLTNVWLNVANDWEGHFTINRGPCDAVDGGAVYGQPPMAGLDRLSFTPIKAGPHEISVMLKAHEPEVPTSIPVSCHDCLAPPEEAAKEIEYRLTSSESGSA